MDKGDVRRWMDRGDLMRGRYVDRGDVRGWMDKGDVRRWVDGGDVREKNGWIEVI